MRRHAERTAGMVIKEFRQIFRDPRIARVIFIAPVIQLLIFGYAVSTDIAHTPAFLVDHDRSRASRELVDSLTASGYFLASPAAPTVLWTWCRRFRGETPWWGSPFP